MDILPVEIWWKIASYLPSMQDLESLKQVCRFMYSSVVTQSFIEQKCWRSYWTTYQACCRDHNPWLSDLKIEIRYRLNEIINPALLYNDLYHVGFAFVSNNKLLHGQVFAQIREYSYAGKYIDGYLWSEDVI